MNATAQLPEGEAAERAVRGVIDALAARRWDEAAGLVHPDALHRFRLEQIGNLRMREMERADAVDRWEPHMPPEVRAWFDEKRRENEARFGIADEFAGVGSLPELEGLTDRELFARFVEARDPITRAVRGHETRGQPLPPGFMEALPRPERRIVGSVVEDDSTVQVLYRTEHGSGRPGDPYQLGVATVRRAPEGWRVWTDWNEDGLFGWGNMSIFLGLAVDQEQLGELRDRPFTWPSDGEPRVRASIEGDAGDGVAPAAIVLEAAHPDGGMARVELPHAALMPLVEYLQPLLFTHFPEPPR